MLISIFAFVVAFGLLVIVHEFGHFWVARRAGVAVDTFSIGFGPKLWHRKWKETDFCISLIPLGGYVKMRGEGDEKEADKNDFHAFANKSVLARSAVVLAGPFMNLVLSFLLVPLVFWIGKPQADFLNDPVIVERILSDSPSEKADLKIGDKILRMDGQQVPTWKSFLAPILKAKNGQILSLEIQREGETRSVKVKAQTLPGAMQSYLGIEKYFGEAPPPVIDDVLDGTPAKESSLKAQDRVLAIQNRPVQNWDDLLKEVKEVKGEELTLSIARAEQRLELKINPRWDEENNRWILGVQGPKPKTFSLLQIRDYSFLEAITTGFKVNAQNIWLTFMALKKLVTAEVSVKTLGGPVAIASSLAEASAQGFPDFLFFTAFLSVQLAVLNLLPIPVLDGGHLVFFGIEALRRKPLSLKARMIAQQIGMALLLGLIFFVTWNDILRLLKRV